jgi:DNA (cytosine-5)-methyltransferase 1
MRFVDLCCGVGGLSRSLHEIGGQCVLACDIDKYTKITYEANYGAANWHTDVTKLDEKIVPDHDVLFAGFPCQPFSNAGLKGGFDDTRGTIFFDVARIIKEKLPRYFLLENVKGLLSHEKGKTFATIITTLQNLGYDVQWQIVNAIAFVPQKRKRVFILGQLAPHIKLPTNITNYHSNTLNSIYHNDGNVVLSDGDRFYVPTVGIQDKFFFSPQARDYAISYTEKKRLTGGFGYQYVTGTDLANTVTARCANGCSNTINDDPLRPRKLTPRETFRLMGFPDSFILPYNVSNAQLYKQAGNSVVPACAEVFIKEMKL